MQPVEQVSFEAESDPADSRRGRLLPWELLKTAGLIIVLILVGCWFALVLRENYADVKSHLDRASPLTLGLALALIGVMNVCLASVYADSLDVVGHKIALGPVIRAVFASNLGKYMPGKVVSYLGLFAFARRQGISIQQWTVAMVVHHIAVLGVGIVLGACALFPAWPLQWIIFLIGSIPLLVVMASGSWLRLLPKLSRLFGCVDCGLQSQRTFLYATLCASAGWLAYGSCAALLCGDITGQWSPQLMFHVTFAAILAWIAGFASIVTPAGIGVREACFVFLVQPSISAPLAIVISLILRLLWTLFDGTAGSVALYLSVKQKRLETTKT